MRSRGSKSPSPALIVAAIALVVAMAGTSIAQDPAAKLTRSKVKEIAKKQINKAAPKLSVAKASSADSAAIASKAEQASTATSANTAQTVNGFRIEKFSRSSTTVTSPTGEPFVSAGGLNLSFVCLGPNAEVGSTATTTADNARISVTGVSEEEQGDGNNFTTLLFDDEFDTGEEFNATPFGLDHGYMNLTYHAADGTVVSAQYRASVGGPEGCVIDGTLTVG